jgi:hypothetical protein
LLIVSFLLASLLSNILSRELKDSKKHPQNVNRKEQAMKKRPLPLPIDELEL